LFEVLTLENDPISCPHEDILKMTSITGDETDPYFLIENSNKDQTQEDDFTMNTIPPLFRISSNASSTDWSARLNNLERGFEALQREYVERNDALDLMNSHEDESSPIIYDYEEDYSVLDGDFYSTISGMIHDDEINHVNADICSI
jgi:hypothetical protein